MLQQLLSHWRAFPRQRPVRPLFHDAGLQASFERDGYVIVPFVDAVRRRTLLDLFAELDPGLQSGFHVSLHSSDATYRAAVRKGLNELGSDLPARYVRDGR